MIPAMPNAVSGAFCAFPHVVRPALLEIRALIFETAAKADGVGPITETLKWGEPAYLTEASGSGTTIRLASSKAHATHAALLFNCRTTLIADFRDLFCDVFTFEGNRAMLVGVDRPLPRDQISTCIVAALNYHRRKPR